MKELGNLLIIFSLFILLSVLLVGKTEKYVASYKRKKKTGEFMDDKEKWMYAIYISRNIAYVVLLVGLSLIILN